MDRDQRIADLEDAIEELRDEHGTELDKLREFVTALRRTSGECFTKLSDDLRRLNAEIVQLRDGRGQ
jgi:hypothetical protein